MKTTWFTAVYYSLTRVVSDVFYVGYFRVQPHPIRLNKNHELNNFLRFIFIDHNFFLKLVQLMRNDRTYETYSMF